MVESVHLTNAIDAAVPRVTSDEVLARLAEARRGMPHGVVASDADGTIWDGDVGFDLFGALLAERGVREAARDALAAEARSIGIAAEGDANALATALFAAYGEDRYPHDRAFAMMAWAFAGWHRDELRAFCDWVLDRGGIEERVRPGLRAVFAWAKDNGVDAYVVSASPIEMVLAATARMGLASNRVVAMTPAVDPSGVLQPRLSGPIVYGEGKLAALELTRPGASLLAAFGDSAYDAAMLRVAQVPVAVTPAPALAAIAGTIERLVVLGR
jgi:phosphoserine phosphatase